MMSNTNYYSWVIDNIVDPNAPTEDDLIRQLDNEPVEEAIVQDLSNDEVQKIILHLLNKLSDTHRVLLTTKFLNGTDVSIRSLGATVGLGKTRTNVQYHKALEALKKLLLEEYPSLFIAYKVEMASPVMGRPRKRIVNV
jgi:DNA-directed RNA polymerase specialized sigma24 family protein